MKKVAYVGKKDKLSELHPSRDDEIVGNRIKNRNFEIKAACLREVKNNIKQIILISIKMKMEGR